MHIFQNDPQLATLTSQLFILIFLKLDASNIEFYVLFAGVIKSHRKTGYLNLTHHPKIFFSYFRSTFDMAQI